MYNCAGPFPAPPMPGSINNRNAERIQILGDLHGEVMIYQPMAIKEISRGGVLIETGFPLQIDSLHEFRLTLGEQSIVVKGRVAHSRISDLEQELVRYRSGIEFIEPNENVTAAIARFVEAIKSGRRAL
jgi:PilZ domain